MVVSTGDGLRGWRMLRSARRDMGSTDGGTGPAWDGQATALACWTTWGERSRLAGDWARAQRGPGRGAGERTGGGNTGSGFVTLTGQISVGAGGS